MLFTILLGFLLVFLHQMTVGGNSTFFGLLGIIIGGFVDRQIAKSKKQENK
jgi:hypothetical protein